MATQLFRMVPRAVQTSAAGRSRHSPQSFTASVFWSPPEQRTAENSRKPAKWRMPTVFPDGAEIKVEFRKLAKVHHPDLHGGDKAAAQRFQLINCAYDVLKKPDARAAYDAACAFARARARRQMRSVAVAMAASFLLTVTSGLAVAGWMRIEGII